MRKTLFRDPIYDTPFRYEYAENQIRHECYFDVWKKDNIVFSLTMEGADSLTPAHAQALGQTVKAVYCIYACGQTSSNLLSLMPNEYDVLAKQIRSCLKNIHFGEEIDSPDAKGLRPWLIGQFIPPRMLNEPERQLLGVAHEGATMKVEFPDLDAERATETMREMMLNMNTGFAQLLSASNQPVPDWLKNVLIALKEQ